MRKRLSDELGLKRPKPIPKLGALPIITTLHWSSTRLRPVRAS